MSQYTDTLSQFTLAAKAIIYDAKRGKQLLQMMTTVSGTLMAVHSVISAISRKKEVPSAVAPLLGVSILMVLIDLGMSAGGKQPPKALVTKVAKELLSHIHQTYPIATSPVAPKAGGLIQGAW